MLKHTFEIDKNHAALVLHKLNTAAYRCVFFLLNPKNFNNNNKLNLFIHTLFVLYEC